MACAAPGSTPVSSAKHIRFGSDPDVELRREGITVNAALQAWRRKAADILLVVVAAAHLPVIVLGILGHGPPLVPIAKVIGLAAYLVLVAVALLRSIDYRRRLVACFVALYPALAVANLIYPHGPYAQVGAVTMPVFVLVLLGPREARIAFLASILIILTGPLLRVQSGVVDALGIEVAGTGPPGLVWFRTAVKAASLLGLMFLLDRFHRFLLDTLAERIVAQRKMEREMRERQRLEREVAAISDGERRRLGQELHDGVCQQVTAALLRCEAMERRLERGGLLSSADFAPLSSLLAETIDDAHSVARGLCPLGPYPDALAPALRALIKRTEQIAGLRCEFRTAGDVRVKDPEAAQHLYRVAQEALSNAVRHANASRIVLELSGNDGKLMLQVEDNGVGMPPELPTGGMGLRTMAYRAQIIKGELMVEPVPGGGTRVWCRVPLSCPSPSHHASEQALTSDRVVRLTTGADHR